MNGAKTVNLKDFAMTADDLDKRFMRHKYLNFTGSKTLVFFVYISYD